MASLHYRAKKVVGFCHFRCMQDGNPEDDESMQFFSTDQMGVTLVDPSKEQRLMLLQSVAHENEAEFPEVYLSNRNGIVIGYRSDGCLFWEEQGEVTHYIPHADVPSAMHAWNLLIANDRQGLESLDWITIRTT